MQIVGFSLDVNVIFRFFVELKTKNLFCGILLTFINDFDSCQTIKNYKQKQNSMQKKTFVDVLGM